MLVPLLFSLAAIASPMHTGIPVFGVDGIDAPSFQGSRTGWTALVEGGFVAVFVGKDEVEAQFWVDQKTEYLEAYKPKEHPTFKEETQVDLALGDGVGLLIFRDKNVAVMCRNRANAGHWAQRLHSAIIDIPAPWPLAPTLKSDALGWIPEAPESTVHLAFQGGQTDATPRLRFTKPPTRLIAWDGWGRAAATEIPAK
jgi:hypothetical protein